MLVDYEYSMGKLIVSYVDSGGRLKMVHYPWKEPKQYKRTNATDPYKDDKYVAWDGSPLTWYIPKYPNRYSVYDFIDALPESEQELLFSYHEPKTYFMDIETEVIDEFPDPVNAKTRVLANSIVHADKGFMMGLKDLSPDAVRRIEDKVNDYVEKFGVKYSLTYKKYDSEYFLMNDLFNNMIPKMPVITGWNFIAYDWVYLVNRAKKLDINPNVSSPTGKLDRVWDKKDGYKNEELPKHRIIVDYMELYKKWDTSVKIKDSSSLNFVAEQILGIKKVEYDGTLQQLYENDFEQYMFYNIIDVILVQLIHEKRRYIDIMFAISTLSRIRVTDAFSTIRTTEGILRGPLRKDRNILLVKDSFEESDEGDREDLAGGYVKKPIPGMYRWTSIFDFASLYPTTMRQFNIAPESYMGALHVEDDKKYALYNGKKTELTDDDIVLLNRAVFKNDDSVTKQVLGNIFSDRKKNKKLMLEAKSKRLELEHQLKELESGIK
jgi:DNA polymerase elongation subunit (family B)